MAETGNLNSKLDAERSAQKPASRRLSLERHEERTGSPIQQIQEKVAKKLNEEDSGSEQSEKGTALKSLEARLQASFIEADLLAEIITQFQICNNVYSVVVERMRAVIKANCIKAERTYYVDGLKAQNPKVLKMIKMLGGSDSKESPEEVAKGFDKVRAYGNGPRVEFYEETFFLDQVDNQNAEVMMALKLVDDKRPPEITALFLDRANYDRIMDHYQKAGELETTIQKLLGDLQHSPTIKSCIEKRNPVLFKVLENFQRLQANLNF